MKRVEAVVVYGVDFRKVSGKALDQNLRTMGVNFERRPHKAVLIEANNENVEKVIERIRYAGDFKYVVDEFEVEEEVVEEPVLVGFEKTVVREFNSGDMVTVPSGDKAEVLFFAKPEQKYAVLLDSNTTGEVELFEASELTKYVEDGYMDALMRSIEMFAELVANDYNGATHCKARLDELVNELLAEGYESLEELKVGDTIVTNKKGQHHNVGKVYEVTFDGSYIVTFGGIYIAQCYDREELILI